jgi:enoyl-CoA hydratase/carnithine racemase
MAALNEAYKSPAHHEAIAAFIEKRPPNFKNLA